jgi:LDH2 family malate/lactate/ureidoglycolate dehydrogenase
VRLVTSVNPETAESEVTTRWWAGNAERSIHVTAEDARRSSARMLMAHGVPRDDAVQTAAHLVEGSLRGYPAHGIDRLRQIDVMLRKGTLNPKPRRRITRRSPAVTILDGDRGLGPPAASEAVACARDLASRYGVGLVGVLASGHLGTLGPWAEQLAGDDQFGLVVSASEPGVVAPGGKRPVFGTNPIAYAWPSDEGPVVADFTTAATTRSELLRQAESGGSLPPRVAVDAEGRGTQDAREALSGGLLPLRDDHKGVLLSLLAGMLAGPVVGGPAPHEVTGTRDAGAPPDKADFLLAIDLGATTEVGTFLARGASLRAMLGAPDSGAFPMPGTGSRERRARAAREGVHVSAATAALLWPESAQRDVLPHG